MMPRLGWALFVLAVLLSSCDDKPAQQGIPATSAPTTGLTATKSTGFAPQPSAEPLPPLLDQVVKKASADEMLTEVRLLVRRVTVEDGVRVVVRWTDQRADGLPAGAPLAKWKIDWQATLSSVTLELRKGEGPWRKLKVGKGGPYGERSMLDVRTALAMRFDAKGLSMPLVKPHPWAAGATDLFDGPGKYTVRMAGKLAVADGARSFETGELELEVREPSADHLTIANAEVAAERHIQKHHAGQQELKRRKETVEDRDGNRVVRFAAHVGMGDGLFVEVVVTPAGKVLATRDKHMFTCVAEGTLIETRFGALPVEAIQVGDRVWGYDPVGERRVLTRVRAVTASTAAQIIELAPGLRLTPEHPVFVAGEWVMAGRVGDGARLLRSDSSYEQVAAGRVVDAPTRVFDLAVEWPHTFFAAGRLVHNKAAATGAIGLMFGDDWDSVLFRASTKTEWDRQPRPGR